MPLPRAAHCGGTQPLSATVLALLQQLDDLSDALLGDLPAGGDTQSRGQPRGDRRRAGGTGEGQRLTKAWSKLKVLM